MGWARVTIGATMFTAPIGVDGLVKADIGRVVPRNDGAALVKGDRGIEPGLWIIGLIGPPSIIYRGVVEAFEPSGRIRNRAAPDAWPVGDRCSSVGW